MQAECLAHAGRVRRAGRPQADNLDIVRARSVASVRVSPSKAAFATPKLPASGMATRSGVAVTIKMTPDRCRSMCRAAARAVTKCVRTRASRPSVNSAADKSTNGQPWMWSTPIRLIEMSRLPARSTTTSACSSTACSASASATAVSAAPPAARISLATGAPYGSRTTADSKRTTSVLDRCDVDRCEASEHQRRQAQGTNSLPPASRNTPPARSEHLLRAQRPDPASRIMQRLPGVPQRAGQNWLAGKLAAGRPSKPLRSGANRLVGLVPLQPLCSDLRRMGILYAELVAFRIGHHYPGLVVALANIDAGGSQPF